MKRVVITAIDRDGLEFTFANIVLDVDDDMDMKSVRKAIEKASTEYCQTEEGKKVFIGNCHNFNYGDFDTYVPNDICVKHGILKVCSDISFNDVDFNTQLVSETDVFGENDDCTRIFCGESLGDACIALDIANINYDIDSGDRIVSDNMQKVIEVLEKEDIKFDYI